MKLTRELLRRFENHYADHVESLMRESLAEPGNSQGYAFYHDGLIRATASSNPHASWATCAYGLNQQPAENVRRAIDFFSAHGVPARARIIPDGFTPQQADVLHGCGLRHIGFHTILWSPLSTVIEPDQSVDIRETSGCEQIDTHIDLQLGISNVPQEAIDRLRPLRRRWWDLPRLRFYLAYVDGVPAAQAVLDWSDDLAYLASAGTLPQFRNRGLQTALIQRRLADAKELGCKVVFGGSDFESNSRTNQMACGLQVAYTSALWTQPKPA